MISVQVVFTAPPAPHKTQKRIQSHGQGSSTTSPAPGTLLLYRVQNMRIHYPSGCWLILYFFSAVYLLNTSVKFDAAAAARPVAGSSPYSGVIIADSAYLLDIHDTFYSCS
ncbi:hypothetical protein BDR04DRAFT_1108054 [Suillus decipiens]|nr:hypothetical protein BDR04DRAFT_1108054 [Suillus decipiens]